MDESTYLSPMKFKDGSFYDNHRIFSLIMTIMLVLIIATIMVFHIKMPLVASMNSTYDEITYLFYNDVNHITCYGMMMCSEILTWDRYYKVDINNQHNTTDTFFENKGATINVFLYVGLLLGNILMYFIFKFKNFMILSVTSNIVILIVYYTVFYTSFKNLNTLNTAIFSGGGVLYGMSEANDMNAKKLWNNTVIIEKVFDNTVSCFSEINIIKMINGVDYIVVAPGGNINGSYLNFILLFPLIIFFEMCLIYWIYLYSLQNKYEKYEKYTVLLVLLTIMLPITSTIVLATKN